MSAIIYQTFSKTLKFTSAYSHYRFSQATGINFVYSDTGGYMFYNTSDATPNANVALTGTTEIDNLYPVTISPPFTVAFSTDSSIANTSTSQEFYVANDTDKIDLTVANENAPISLVVQEIYPSSKDYSLLDGSFVTYKSNTKHKIVFGFDYLPKETLDDFIYLSKSTVIIVPEREVANVNTIVSTRSYKVTSIGSTTPTQWEDLGAGNTPPTDPVVGTIFTASINGTSSMGTGTVSTNVSPFENKAYVCNWEGSNLNFQYSTSYKRAGYKGQISFREV